MPIHASPPRDGPVRPLFPRIGETLPFGGLDTIHDTGILFYLHRAAGPRDKNKTGGGWTWISFPARFNLPPRWIPLPAGRFWRVPTRQLFNSCILSPPAPVGAPYFLATIFLAGIQRHHPESFQHSVPRLFPLPILCPANFPQTTILPKQPWRHVSFSHTRVPPRPSPGPPTQGHATTRDRNFPRDQFPHSGFLGPAPPLHHPPHTHPSPAIRSHRPTRHGSRPR